MPMTSPTVDPSTVCHSIEGWGLPVAEQSRKPPDELLNSSLGGGSITKLGPRKWASNGRALGDSRLTSRWLCGRGGHRRIFRDNTWGEQWEGGCMEKALKDILVGHITRMGEPVMAWDMV